MALLTAIVVFCYSINAPASDFSSISNTEALQSVAKIISSRNSLASSLALCSTIITWVSSLRNLPVLHAEAYT
ncbi:hypothetical protein PIIN_10989 [Serendipita indica DSM 11827]|uniref:Uncharacterized protein n=1 Tax=Serendipita indica (strain DSM 11827) TaxID=1109443 RepID=G4U0B1_SERID|nr:hypothetical protein PIIN_10989 [Serendipita indica DSM 11827]